MKPLTIGTLLAWCLFVVGTAKALCPDEPPQGDDETALMTGWLADSPFVTVEITRTIQFADITGLGFDALCFASEGAVACVTHQNDASCYLDGDEVVCDTATDECAGFGDHFTGTAFPFDITGNPAYAETLAFPDLDADGDHDVCVRGPDGVYCARSDGRHFGPARRWSGGFGDNFGWGQPQYYTTVAFPDVNADGRADLCGRGAAGIYCAISTGTAFTRATIWTQGDFGNAGGWGSDPAYYRTLQFADIDGDGDDDICGRGSAGIYCALADPLLHRFKVGSYWTHQYSDASNWNQPQYYETLQFADINGDGMADVCGRGSGGVWCGISFGSNEEFYAADVLDVPAFSNANGWAVPEHYRTLVLSDVDGDGTADVCGRGDQGIYCALANSWLAGFLSGWTDLFGPTQLRIPNFGDNAGWGADEIYWGTVQPANVVPDKGNEFCGRGYAGIWCSY